MNARRVVLAVLLVPLLMSCREEAPLTGPPEPMVLEEATTDAGSVAFDHFVADASTHEWANSYLMALLSHYMYKSSIGVTDDAAFLEAFAAHFAPLGLHRFGLVSDPLSDTEAVIVENDDAIIIAFRGTEADDPTVVFDLYVDLAGSLINGIHDGFQASSRRVLDLIAGEIEAAPGKKVWITGHSLGGAVATVTAHLLTSERAIDVQGVYTFGAPRAFDGTRAAAFDGEFGARSQRWVNDLDPVPHVAPHIPLLLPYQHVNVLNNIVADAGACTVRLGDEERQLTTPEELAEILLQFKIDDPAASLALIAADLFALGNVDDHATARYAARIYASMPAEQRALLPAPPEPDPTKPGHTSCDEPQDVTPPVITPAVTGTLGSNGWYVSDASVTWSLVDEESTIDTMEGCDGASIVADTDGTTFTCTATSAGGTSTASVTVKRDATAPTDVFATADRDADHNGWYSGPFTATWSGSDATSGIDGCSAHAYAGPDTAAGELTGTCTDLAGNTSDVVAFAFRYDATAPLVEIGSPVAGTPDFFQDQAVTAAFACSDATSGTGSCAGTTADGAALPTGSFGAHELRVTATDQAGNVTIATRGYTVSYAFDGFYAPIENLPSANLARAGQRIPLKWNLLDRSGARVADQPGLFRVSWGEPFACDATGVVSEIATDADSNTGVRWDSVEEQYVFVAATSRSDAGVCRYLTVGVGASASARALVRFR